MKPTMKPTIKPMFQPLLARLRGRPKLAAMSGPVDVKAVIERSLRDAGLLPSIETTARTVDETVIDAEFRVLEANEPTANEPTATADASGAGSFSAGRFALGGDSRAYKLFVPAGFAGQQLPLIVMLHGCTQNPDDFARGTRMNVLAQRTGALVLYPAQAQRSNNSRCWNWFQPGDQRREGGEPALLAAMTRHIIARHSVDPRRVHVTGLSAGGAMAAILGREYPDLYASIGVHSGLPPGAAHDIPSAFAAMKKAPVQSREIPTTPLIVFHGDRDQTVDPRNGENLFGAAGLGAGGARSRTTGEAGRGYTRSVITDPAGRVRAEHWLVHGAGHAWSGGSGEGRYADPLGPDASSEMLRFFREHPLR